MEKAIKRYFPIFVLPTMIAFTLGFIIPFAEGVYLSFGGSIDLSCLDQFSRDILDTGNVDDHHITDLLPAHQNDQSTETKGGGIRQRTAEFHQDAV